MARNLGFTELRVSEARAADRLAKQRYQRGVDALLKVLETERRLRLAEQAWITATADAWNARIDLFLALGGDWGTDPPDSETGPTEETETQANSEISNSENSKFEIRNSKSVSRDGWAAILNSEFLIPNSTEVL